MSTVKISQLPELLHLDTNTANTILIGVDVSSCVTSQLTVQTLAEGLYANNVLNVGNNEILFPGVIAQFVGNSSSYLQVNLQNNDANASADYVVTSDIGNDSSYYIDMGIKNSTFNYVGDTASKPLDSYIYSQGDSANSLGGNLVIGTTSSGRAINFLAGGTANSDIIIRMTAAAGLELLQKPIIFADGTSQNTSSLSAGVYANGAFIQSNAAFLQANTTSGVANSAALYANGAFVQANAAFIKANTPPAIANSAALYANGAFVQANAAFTKANNALANTSGTFDGDLNITGTLKASGIITLNNSTFATNTAFLSIVASDGFATFPPSNTNYMIHVTGKANSVTRVVLDSFGQNTYPLVAGRMGRGTAAVPTAVANNDIMMRIVGNGYTGTTFPGSSPTKIDFIAAENFSDTNRGTRIEFWNTPLASNTIQKIASFNADSVTFSGVVEPQKGFVYTPRILQGAQTAITINFATDSMIRGTFSSTLTNSLSNYVAGKVVEMWLTNTAGNGQTVVHGGLANNTTTGATSISVASGRSVHLKYFSVDGDLANTFVAITYA